MKIADVDWLLRYDCDEMVMSQEMLNQIVFAMDVNKAQMLREPLRYTRGVDENGRPVTKPDTLAGRKVTIQDTPSTERVVYLKSAGELRAFVSFPE